MLRLPDTGQDGNYTSTFGEDADYNAQPPFFIKNGNGTVTDTVTGLMWQQTDGGEMTIEHAVAYCDTLTLGGFADWRLPDAHEAFSILNHGYSNPALDPAVFTVSDAQYWWTSVSQANDPTKIWVTNAGGGIGNHPKSETISAGGTKKFHVRAVRAVYPPVFVSNRFSDNGDGTVADHLTDLVWQKTPFSDTLSWEQALNYAENLSLAGKDDWRLPNIKELQSLNDEGLINPSVSNAFFPAIGVKKYWSSTSLPNQTDKAWYLDTRFGITTYREKTGKNNLICVRGLSGETTSAVAPVLVDACCPVFPNPFQSRLCLKSPTGKEYFELINAFGQVVFSGKDIAQQDFSGLPAGVYFLKISDSGTSMVKLIKNKP